jgi:hypothetical protein
MQMSTESRTSRPTVRRLWPLAFAAVLAFVAAPGGAQEQNPKFGTVTLNKLVVQDLATPAAPTLTIVGTPGATSRSYRISAVNSRGETLASTAGTTATSNATLSVSNFVRAEWAGVSGAAAYRVYGRASGSELLMATVPATNQPLRFDDTGALTPSGALPTANTAGGSFTATTIEKLSLEAAICQNATAVTHWSTPTTNPAVAACVTGSNTQRGVLDFADGANALSVQRQLVLPADWTGALDAVLVWHTTATAGDVVWQLATVCVADAETGDPAFNAASTVTDTAKGTTLQFNTASLSSITTTGCAAGEVLFLKLTRDPAHASDTLAATARLVALELSVRRART